jgi:hypothetical protein
MKFYSRLLKYYPSALYFLLLIILSLISVETYHIDRVQRIKADFMSHNNIKSRKSTSQFRRYLVFGIDCQSYPNLYKFIYSSAEAGQCLATSDLSNVVPNFSFNPFDDALLLLGVMALSVLLKRIPAVESSEDSSIRSEEIFGEDKTEAREDGLSECPMCRGNRLYQRRACEACQGTGLIAKFGLPPQGRDNKLEPWDADEL